MKKIICTAVFVLIGIAASALYCSVFKHSDEEYIFQEKLQKEKAEFNLMQRKAYDEDKKTIADYKNADDLIENLLKKYMNVTDKPVKFTNNACKNGKSFQKENGVIYCIDEDVFFIDKNDRKNGACNIYSTVPCNKDLSPETVTIWIDVNGEKSPNKLSTFRAENCIQHTDPIYRECSYKGRINDIIGFVLYSQKLMPANQFAYIIFTN